MKLHINNRAKWIGKRHNYDYYDWEVYVDEGDAVLDSIDYVVYVLHKTFPDPVRTMKNRDDRFALRSRGWGEFDLRITAYFKDGSYERLLYSLDLSKEWNDSG